jgi:hypothetical protein
VFGPGAYSVIAMAARLEGSRRRRSGSRLGAQPVIELTARLAAPRSDR